MTIHFYIRFYTRPGQSLAVTGNTEELGNNTIEKALPLTWLNNDFWTGSLTLKTPPVEPLHYHYVFKDTDGTSVMEWDDHKIIAIKPGVEEVSVIDTWNPAGEFENAFYTDPFQQILLKENETTTRSKTVKQYTHI